MNTLVLNPGSRWLKAKVYSAEGKELLFEKFDIVDRAAQDTWLEQLEDVKKIGLRVVHGGELSSPKLLDAETLKTIEYFSTFAPLHNPIALEIAKRAGEHFSGVPIYCVFDTHFHRTLPAEAYTYPISTELAQKHKIRRYGFHGIALESVLAQLQEKREAEGKPTPKKLIMAHLGGGTSITAVKNGQSVATSMGMTPLGGAMMITRSGTIDPDITRVLSEKAGLTCEAVSKILNEDSGFQGLLHSTDTKQIIADAVVGKQPQQLVLTMYVRSIVEKIFSYYGLIQGADALVFSGGIGFRNDYIRPEILKWTEIIGLSDSNTYAFEADETQVIFNQIREL